MNAVTKIQRSPQSHSRRAPHTGSADDVAIGCSGEGADFGLATQTKGTIRHQIEALIKKANRTAGSIAEESEPPETMQKFRMPHERGDETLKNRAAALQRAWSFTVTACGGIHRLLLCRFAME